jgi:hypothetical protein
LIVIHAPQSGDVAVSTEHAVVVREAVPKAVHEPDPRARASTLILIVIHALPRMLQVQIPGDFLHVAVEPLPTMNDEPDTKQERRHPQQNGRPDADPLQQR